MKLTAIQCDNCRDFILPGNLETIKDYSERVADGESVPSGQCPSCGCLCHEVEITLRHRFKVTEGDSDFNTFHIFGETREIAGLDAVYESAINDALGFTRTIAELTYPGENGTLLTSDMPKAVERLKDIIMQARALDCVTKKGE